MNTLAQHMKRLGLFRPREKFLILEITPTGAAGLFLSLDEDHNLIFEKLQKNINLKKFFKSPVRNVSQKSWEGEYFFKGHRKVIAVAHSSMATTIPVPIQLERDHAVIDEEIILGELENLIAQAMGKVFNQCRSEAAKRLGIDDLDTVLVGAKAKDFKVGASHVVNPVGFVGKDVALLLELTFTSRELFEDLKQFFNSPEDFFFAESSQVRLSSLARVRKLPINLIYPDDTTTPLFIFEKAKDQYPVLYREPFTWNFKALFSRISEELGVTEETAQELYELYLKGEMSESAMRSFKRLVDPAVEELFKEVEKAKLKGTVYVDSSHSLPFALPYRHAGATFDELPLAEVLTSLGFTDVQGAALRESILSRHVFPFLEAYFDKTNSDINQKLRRRLHWLTK